MKEWCCGGNGKGVGWNTVETISISVMHVATIKIYKIKTGTMFSFLYFFAIFPSLSIRKKVSLYTFNHGVLQFTFVLISRAFCFLCLCILLISSIHEKCVMYKTRNKAENEWKTKLGKCKKYEENLFK